MGRSSDDSGGRPNDGGVPDDLPDLPEEWGVIVIPDDLSELTDEVAAVRAELLPSLPRTRRQRFAARPAVRRLRRALSAGVRAPMLIVLLAVLVTVASLFASTWSGPARPPSTPRTTSADDRSTTLPALELLDAGGQAVALRGRLPAVILVTDGCDCARLVADTTAAVRPDIAVVTVTVAQPSTGTAPPTGTTPQAQGKTVRVLRDPTGGLRADLRLGAPDGTATALLVDRGGAIVRLIPRATSAEVLLPHLAGL